MRAEDGRPGRVGKGAFGLAMPDGYLPIELRVRDVVIRIASGSDVAYIAALVDALRA
jgi:hypothetical protein